MVDFQVAASSTLEIYQFLMNATEVAIPLMLWVLTDRPSTFLTAPASEITSLRKKEIAFLEIAFLGILGEIKGDDTIPLQLLVFSK